MSNHKLNAENTKKLIDAINYLFMFSVNYEVNPFVSMHLHKAIMHLETELPPKKKPLVRICMTPEGFGYFVKNVLTKKPVPINNFMKKEK
jgi:transcriptional regulatory protein LevR